MESKQSIEIEPNAQLQELRDQVKQLESEIRELELARGSGVGIAGPRDSAQTVTAINTHVSAGTPSLDYSYFPVTENRRLPTIRGQSAKVGPDQMLDATENKSSKQTGKDLPPMVSVLEPSYENHHQERAMQAIAALHERVAQSEQPFEEDFSAMELEVNMQPGCEQDYQAQGISSLHKQTVQSGRPLAEAVSRKSLAAQLEFNRQQMECTKNEAKEIAKTEANICKKEACPEPHTTTTTTKQFTKEKKLPDKIETKANKYDENLEAERQFEKPTNQEKSLQTVSKNRLNIGENTNRNNVQRGSDDDNDYENEGYESVKELKQKYTKLQKELKEFEMRHQAISGEKDMLQHKVYELEDEIVELADERNDLEMALNEEQTATNALKADLQAAMAKANRLETVEKELQLAKADRDQKQKQKQLEAANEPIRTVSSMAQASWENISRAVSQRANAALKEQHEHYNKKINELQQEIANLNVLRKQEIESLNEQHQKEIANLNAQHQQESNKLKVENNELKAENNGVKVQNKGVEAYNNILKAQNNGLKAVNDDLVLELEQVRIELNVPHGYFDRMLYVHLNHQQKKHAAELELERKARKRAEHELSVVRANVQMNQTVGNESANTTNEATATGRSKNASPLVIRKHVRKM